jgi:DNA repair exonuclease SbcCD ATPase subunit
MRVRSLQFKNFASYGNRLQHLEFDREQSDLYLVLGSNGAGKSTLAKVITYLCYGKVEGANLRDLPNRVNKELWGTITLESKGNVIEIERGINPNVFNVKINGEEYDVAGKINLQDFLETEMYEIPYHVFKNVIILSVNDFKSFITMSPYDKKMIIDRIFGFSVINEMRELVKNKRKAVVEQIRTLDDEIRTLDDSIQSVLAKIEEIEKISKEKSNEKTLNLKKQLVDLNDNRKKLLDANEKAKAKITEYDLLTKESSRKETEISNDIKHTKKWLKLYENKTCPTCSSPLDSEFHQDVKKSKQDHLDSLLAQYDDIKSDVKTIEDQLTDMRNKGRQISIKVGQLEAQMKSLKNEIIKLAENESEDSDYFKQLVEEFNEKKESKGESKLNIEGEDYYLTILENLMGEDGIKNLAIRSILPSFNNHIDLMAKEMGIPFGMKFDDKFNCTIYHLGQEISPKTLSTGERKKADFVIIMAMIKMIKVRFPSLNILFLDEIFSSIDSDGVYHIISILHETIRDVGLNTFVINHTVLPSEYFDCKIEITKDAGFSDFSVEVIG